MLNRNHEIRAYERAIRVEELNANVADREWRTQPVDSHGVIIAWKVARKARHEAICGLCRVLDAKGGEIRLDTPSACTCFYDANLGRLVRCGRDTCRHG